MYVSVTCDLWVALLSQRYAECGGDLYQLYGETGYDVNTDPFTDPISAQLIGRASVYLDALTYLLDIDETTPIIDYKVSALPDHHQCVLPCVLLALTCRVGSMPLYDLWRRDNCVLTGQRRRRGSYSHVYAHV